MKIYINGRFLTQKITGVQRYAVEVVKQFDRLIAEGIIKDSVDLAMLAPNRPLYDLNLKHIPISQIGRSGGHLWEQTDLSLASTGNWLLNMGNTAPIFNKKTLVTIHSASVCRVPNAYSFGFRLWYRQLHTILGKQAYKILTVSEFAKKDIADAYHIAPQKIVVTHLGCDHIHSIQSDDSIFEAFHMGAKPYVLAVGSVYPLKNLEILLMAASLLDHQKLDIVIAGEANPKVFSSFQFNHAENIKWVGHVSTQRLKALYENALCLVHPSLYESFGLPPLEAMACGCPVIAANTTSLPEVCADAALYFDPHNQADLADKINLLYENKSKREEYKTRGIERSKNFTWAKTAEKTWQVLESIAENYAS